MASSTGTGQNSADLAAQRAAEQAAREAEERRRKEIMEKIWLLEQEKTECQGLESAFLSMRGNLEGIISRIYGLKAVKLQPESNSFSGATADTLCAGIAGVQESIGKKNSRISDVVSTISTQIGLLNSYTIELEGEKYHIPATIVDVKADSAPDGIFQTGTNFAGDEEDTGHTGPIVEWYVERYDNEETQAGDKTTGLYNFNQNASIIFYDDDVLK